jgi:beta-lactamase class A
MRGAGALAGLLAALHAQPLDQKIRAAIAGFPGSVALYAQNLDTGRSYGLRADEKVPPASTIKVPIMVTVFAEVAAGRAAWEETIPIRGAAKIGGSGAIREMSDGFSLNLHDLTRLMIVVSDNTATNLLLERFPPATVNREMDRLGLHSTRTFRAIGSGVTTPREMAALLEMIANGKVVSPAASREMLDILKRQQYKVGIGRHLPDDEVASKHGALDRLRADVGIVFTPGGRVAIAVTVDNLPAQDYSPDNIGEKLIADLTRILLEGLSP